MEAIQIDGVFDVQASKLHQNLDGVGVEPKGPISTSTKNFGEDGVTSSASYTKYGDVQKIETVTLLKLNAYVLKSRCRYISLLSKHIIMRLDRERTTTQEPHLWPA
ncbi:unnamed protein product [Brassica napus]|uniref:(rape) hypothetical protein n=1 Tax=Brassica napus TaxID=3708 RepID=A0A816K3K5_BRANA|nr:unnamed protein product [Brassica napus]